MNSGKRLGKEKPAGRKSTGGIVSVVKDGRAPLSPDMKPCGYCGRQNDDAALHCIECGTSFTGEHGRKFADVWHWTPKSPLGFAFASGLGTILICTGIFFSLEGNLLAISRTPSFGETGVPTEIVSFSLTFSHPAITLTVFSLGVLTFTFFTCYNRCRKESHGILTAIIAVAVIALLTIAPSLTSSLFSLVWFVPMVLIGVGAGSSIGYYAIAVLQVLVGIWLLGWLKRRNV